MPAIAKTQCVASSSALVASLTHSSIQADRKNSPSWVVQGINTNPEFPRHMTRAGDVMFNVNQCLEIQTTTAKAVSKMKGIQTSFY